MKHRGFSPGDSFPSLKAIQRAIPEETATPFVICAVSLNGDFKTYHDSRLVAMAERFGAKKVFKVEKTKVTCMADLVA